MKKLLMKFAQKKKVFKCNKLNIQILMKHS